MTASSSAIGALWLATFERLCARSAHELKGALNGVSLNLEVVRSRSAKAESPASAVASFATAAAAQFDAVMDMTEALLALGRPAADPVDLGATVRWVVALLAPAVKADGHELRIDGPLGSLGTSPVQPNAARLAVGAVLLAAVESAGVVVCRAVGDRLEVALEDGGARLDDAVVAAVQEVGIAVSAEPSAISISFPR